jgi:TPR repeat protein
MSNAASIVGLVIIKAMCKLLFTVCTAFAWLACAPPLGAQPNPDVERALAAVRVRANAGDVVAQFSLGSILYYGAHNTAEAVEWFKKAAAHGYAPAEFQMGQLYDFGFGVEPDDAQALAWYRKAAEHGSAAGQRTVGDFFQKGRGVTADVAEAARWYQRAADGDDLRAQYELGQLYFTGTGVPRDYIAAYVWFMLAACQTPLLDNRKALLELRNIAGARLTAEQVTDAERRAAAWKPAR